MLERGLSYAIDAWTFDPPMKAVRDDSLIVGRGYRARTTRSS